MSGTPVAWDGLRGWLHRPPAGVPLAEALVFLGAQGSEDSCSRHSLTCLADQLAAQGHAVLRLDLPGTGDSLGSMDTPDAWHQWVQATVSAAHSLHRWTAAPAVGLLGLRLGALVAIEASRALPATGLGVRSLLLLAPVLQGRQHIRELRTLSAPGEELVVAGMVWGNHLPQTIQALDASKDPTAPPVEQVFWGVAQPSKALLNAQHAWAATLNTHSARHEHLAEHVGDSLGGYIPVTLWADIQRWMASQHPTPSSRQSTPPNTPQVLAGGNGPPSATLSGEGFTETGVLIPSAVALAGVWCQPMQPDAAACTVVFCNTGRNPHTGWARGWVHMARSLAQNGIASLRFDIAGVGDSPPLPHPPAELLYNQISLPQLGDAITQALALRGQPGPVALVGTCSGGYLAFHHACQDARVSHLLLANVQRFVWEDGMSLETAMAHSTKSTGEYLRLALQASTWQRLWRGHVNMRLIANKFRNSFVEKSSGWASRWQDGASTTPAPDPVEHIRQGFQAMSRRGTHIRVVYSADDGGRDEFARYFGSRGRGFTQLWGTRLRILAGADHVFTSAEAQAGLLREIKTLCLPQPAQPGGAAPTVAKAAPRHSD